MATKWVPVESDAMSTQFCAAKEVPAVWSVQVAPESVEVQISPAATIRWVPVESEATVGPSKHPEVEVTVIRLLHVAPASAEVQTSPPGLVPAGPVTATRWFPVKSDATDFQPWPDASVPFVLLVQVIPEVVYSPSPTWTPRGNDILVLGCRPDLPVVG